MLSASSSNRSHQVVGAEEHLDLALRRPISSMDGSGRRVGQEEHRDDDDLEARDAVYGIPDGDGGIPGLGERAGNVLRRPVGGAEGPDAPCPRITGRP